MFLRLLADDKQFATDVTKKATAAGAQGGKAMGAQMAAGLKSTVGKAIGGLGLLFGAQQVLGFLQDARVAFQEDEASVASLTTAIEANVKGWDGNTAAIEKTIKARQELGFSDDEQRSSLDSLVAITKDVTKALDIQRVAMDLARLRGLDLATATELLGKVAGGNIGILSRYGIQIKKGATATEALAAITRIAAGQAEAFADTDLGKAEAATVKLAEAQERLGELFSELQTMILPAVADGFEAIVDVLGDLGTAIDDLPDLPFDADVGDVFAFVADAARSLVDPLGVVRDNLLEEAIAAAEAAEATRDANEAFRRGEHEAGALDATLGDLGEELGETEDAARTLDAALSDLSDQLFGAEILAGDLAEAQKRLNEKIAEGPDSQSAQDVAIHAGEIAELRQRVFELNAEMAKQDGPRAFYNWLVLQEKLIGDTDAGILALIVDMKRLALEAVRTGATVTGFGGGRKPGLTPRASGGPVSAGMPYLVGEHRPEVFVPDTDGGIVPSFAGVALPDPRAWGMAAARAFSGANGPAAVGGNTYSTTLVLEGKTPADPFELFEKAERYQRWGVLNPAVEP